MRHTPGYNLLLICALALAAQACGYQQESHPPKHEIVIGFNPSEKAENVLAKAKVLESLIAERLKMPVKIFVAPDYNGLVEAMRARRVDFAFLPPLSLLHAERVAGGRVLLKVLRGGKPQYYGCIVVNADSGYKSLADLKGKTIAWVDENSTSGYIFPKAELLESGINPDTYFAKQAFARGHDNVLFAVINGQVAAGATYANDTLGIDGSWTQLKDGMFRSKIRPIFFSHPIPPDNFATTQYMQDYYGGLVQKVTGVVQHLADDSAGKATIFALYHVDGMVPALSSDYDPVRKAAALVGVNLTGSNSNDTRNRTCTIIFFAVVAVAGTAWLAGITWRNRSRGHKSASVPLASAVPESVPDAAQLVLQNVGVTFQSRQGQPFTALTDVNLRMQRGEFIAVIGLSGAGKSTLLRCINRMIPAATGRVFFNGRDTSGARGRQLAELRGKMGFVFQQFNLIKNMSALANTLNGRLALRRGPGALLGLFPQSDVAVAEKYLREVGLADKIKSRVDTLSGGQQQRVAIARALAQGPEVILADEPMASLDPKLSQVVLEMLHRFNRQEKITVLVNLHVLDLARQFADRIIGLRKGRVVFDGPPQALTPEIVNEIYKTDEEGAA